MGSEREMAGKKEARKYQRKEPSSPEGQLSPTGLPWPAFWVKSPWPGDITIAGWVLHHCPFVTRDALQPRSCHSPGTSRSQQLAAPGLPHAPGKCLFTALPATFGLLRGFLPLFEVQGCARETRAAKHLVPYRFTSSDFHLPPRYSHRLTLNERYQRNTSSACAGSTLAGCPAPTQLPVCGRLFSILTFSPASRVC